MEKLCICYHVILVIDFWVFLFSVLNEAHSLRPDDRSSSLEPFFTAMDDTNSPFSCRGWVRPSNHHSSLLDSFINCNGWTNSLVVCSGWVTPSYRYSGSPLLRLTWILPSLRWMISLGLVHALNEWYLQNFTSVSLIFFEAASKFRFDCFLHRLSGISKGSFRRTWIHQSLPVQVVSKAAHSHLPTFVWDLGWCSSRLISLLWSCVRVLIRAIRRLGIHFSSFVLDWIVSILISILLSCACVSV